MAERAMIKSEDFPDNSHKTKTKEEIKVEKIVKGKVSRKKQGLGKRAAQELTSSDGDSVMDYILHDVLIPTVKDLIANVISGGVEMLLFGEGRERNTIRDRDRTYVSYGNCYKSNNRRRGSGTRMNRAAAHVYDDLIFDDRREAEDVLTTMVELVDQYGQVTVADLYDLVGQTSNFTDYKWGWDNLASASVARVRDGYSLKLPRAIPID